MFAYAQNTDVNVTKHYPFELKFQKHYLKMTDKNNCKKISV